MNDARLWDRIASRYDTLVRPFSSSYEMVRERLRVDVPRGGRVLEVAAGTGQFTPALADVAGGLVATDLSPKMVDALRARRIGRADATVECAVMSAYDIDAPPAAFDAVFCANALHVMDHPGRALAEFRRVLRPDGVLIAPTFLHGVDGLRRELSLALSAVSPFVAHTRFDLRSLCELLDGCGFAVVRAERLPGLFPIGYVTAHPRPKP